MGIFRTNSEAGKPIRTWPQRLNAILQSFCEALDIQMDQEFTGAQVIPVSAKGAANGVCELDNNAKVPMARLYASATSAPNVIPVTGADGKLSPTFFAGVTALPYVRANISQAGPLSSSLLYPPLVGVSGPLASLFDGTRFVLGPGHYLVQANVFLFGYGVAAGEFEEGLGGYSMLAVTYGTTELPRSLSATRIFNVSSGATLNIRPSFRIPSNFSGISSSYSSVGGNQSSLVIIKLSVL